MKRFLSLVLVVVLVLAMAIPVFAEKNGKTKRPNPNKPISREEFNSSLTSLLEEHGYSWKPVNGKGNITRKEMVMVLGKLLLDENIINLSSAELPFKDIKNIDENTKEKLTALFKEGIINGKSKHTFNLNSKVTYGELKIILERVKELFEGKEDEWDKNTIPFKVKNIVDSRQGAEGIVYTRGKDKNKIIVSVTKKFDTSGYDMEINRIKRVDNRYEIDLSIIPPDKNAILSQVVTYLTTNIEIDAKYLGKSPYKFYTKESIKDSVINKEIPFKQLKTERTHSGKEGIIVKENKDKISLSITKEFPTPGYTMAVEKIFYENGKYKVHLITVSPERDTILPQVIAYRTIHLEIDKDDIGKEPYKFDLEILPLEL